MLIKERKNPYGRNGNMKINGWFLGLGFLSLIDYTFNLYNHFNYDTSINWAVVSSLMVIVFFGLAFRKSSPTKDKEKKK